MIFDLESSIKVKQFWLIRKKSRFWSIQCHKKRFFAQVKLLAQNSVRENYFFSHNALYEKFTFRTSFVRKVFFSDKTSYEKFVFLFRTSLHPRNILFGQLFVREVYFSDTALYEKFYFRTTLPENFSFRTTLCPKSLLFAHYFVRKLFFSYNTLYEIFEF